MTFRVRGRLLIVVGVVAALVVVASQRPGAQRSAPTGYAARPPSRRTG